MSGNMWESLKQKHLLSWWNCRFSLAPPSFACSPLHLPFCKSQYLIKSAMFWLRRLHSISQSISHSVSLVLSLGLLLSFGAMREPSSLPDGMAAVCKYQAALFPPCFPGDYQHCINTEVLSAEHTVTAHRHNTHTHTHFGCYRHLFLPLAVCFDWRERMSSIALFAWLSTVQTPSVCRVVAFILL